MPKYRSVSLPAGLVATIEEHRARHGYVSVIEFVKDSCRRRLEELGHEA